MKNQSFKLLLLVSLLLISVNSILAFEWVDCGNSEYDFQEPTINRTGSNVIEAEFFGFGCRVSGLEFSSSQQLRCS